MKKEKRSSAVPDREHGPEGREVVGDAEPGEEDRELEGTDGRARQVEDEGGAKIPRALGMELRQAAVDVAAGGGQALAELRAGKAPHQAVLSEEGGEAAAPLEHQEAGHPGGEQQRAGAERCAGPAALRAPREQHGEAGQADRGIGCGHGEAIGGSGRHPHARRNALREEAAAHHLAPQGGGRSHEIDGAARQIGPEEGERSGAVLGREAALPGEGVEQVLEEGDGDDQRRAGAEGRGVAPEGRQVAPREEEDEAGPSEEDQRPVQPLHGGAILADVGRRPPGGRILGRRPP